MGSVSISILLCAFMASSLASSVYLDLQKSTTKPQGKGMGRGRGRGFGRGMDGEYDPSVAEPKDKDADAFAPKDALFSEHIPFFLPPMNLTTGELKVFAGHSFQFIKAKCPALPQGKLDSLNKYVAKLISKTDPKQSNSPVLGELVSSLSKCTKDKVTEMKTPIAEDGNTFWKKYFGNFVFANDQSKEPATTEKNEATPEEGDDTGESETVTGRPSVYFVTSPPQKGFYIPYMHTVFWTDSDSKSKDQSQSSSTTSWNPFKWFGNIFKSMREFTKKLFGYSDPSRKKRDVSSDKEAEAETKGAQGYAKESLVNDMITKLKSNPMDGKDAFLHLFDNLCRIYCSTCPHSFPTVNFKAATKELLQFILKDESGSKLAAEHYLDNAFLQALDDC